MSYSLSTVCLAHPHPQPPSKADFLALYTMSSYIFFFFSSTFAHTNSYKKPTVDGVKWHAKNKTKCTLITHKRTEDTGVLFRCHWSDQAELRRTGEGMHIVTLSSFFVMGAVQINKHASVLYSFSLYLACEIETSIFDVFSQRPVPAVLLYKSSASDTLFHFPDTYSHCLHKWTITC